MTRVNGRRKGNNGVLQRKKWKLGRRGRGGTSTVGGKKKELGGRWRKLRLKQGCAKVRHQKSGKKELQAGPEVRRKRGVWAGKWSNGLSTSKERGRKESGGEDYKRSKD